MKIRILLCVLICLLLATSLTCLAIYFDIPLPGLSSPTQTTAVHTTPTLPTTDPPQSTTQTNPSTTVSTQPTTTPTEPTTLPTEPIPPETEPTPLETEPTPPETEPTPPETEPTPPETESTPPEIQQPDILLSAKYAFVWDLNGDQFLYTHGDMEQQISMASITKLFSAYVGLQYLAPDTILTVGEEVSWIDPDSSRAYIYKGHRLTVEQCVQGMIIPSGNDAAYVLAVNAGRAIAGDPDMQARAAYDLFVEEMNRQAEILGLIGTHFTNPDGIDENGHYTTMRDLVIISRLSLENPIIRAAANTQKMKAVFASGHYAVWTNSNSLLDPQNKTFYCPDAIGLKTGSTGKAGKCLISVFQQGDQLLLICVMGCPTNATRYEDTLALYQAFS